jgi:hypothetical protein
MSFRFLSAGLMSCGLTLLGAAGIAYLVAADDGVVSIDEPERELPNCEFGKKLDVCFRIHNPTGHAVRIIGLTQC